MEIVEYIRLESNAVAKYQPPGNGGGVYCTYSYVLVRSTSILGYPWYR
jgi:hypothetical protein